MMEKCLAMSVGAYSRGRLDHTDYELEVDRRCERP